jgi:hypothetical protein
MPDLSDVNPQTQELVEVPPAARNGEPPPRFIDRVLRAEQQARKTVAAPWWGTTIYFRPPTLHVLDAIEQRAPKTALERMAVILLMLAEDEEGRKLFNSGDLYHLMHEVEADHIRQIVEAMLGIKYPTVQAAKEAIEQDPR